MVAVGYASPGPVTTDLLPEDQATTGCGKTRIA